MSEIGQSPRLSVVIASVNGLGCIVECLGHLDALPERDEIEVLVLDRRADGTAARIAERYPWVVLHSGLRGKSIPELRWAGMRAARAPIVAVIEDHCMVTAGWAAEILRRFEEMPGIGVVGGPVENGARERLLDWAFFLAEYGPCMPPLAEGHTEGVPGNNAAYRKAVLPLNDPSWDTLWESFVQSNLRKKDIRIFLSPAMLIYHKKSFRLGEMLSQRFLYSRSFAAMRARSMGLPARLAYAVASVALPPVLLWRVFRNVVAKRRNLREFLLGLPVICLFVTSWAIGEIAGYLAGDGGSLARVE